LGRCGQTIDLPTLLFSRKSTHEYKKSQRQCFTRILRNRLPESKIKNALIAELKSTTTLCWLFRLYCWSTRSMLVVVSLALPSGRSTTCYNLYYIRFPNYIRSQKSLHFSNRNNVTESTDRSSSYEGKGRISGNTYIKTVNSTGIQFVSIHSEGRMRTTVGISSRMIRVHCP
jgi:hypothetical protein